MLLTTDTTMMCCSCVRQLNKEMDFECRICAILYTHTCTHRPQKSVFCYHMHPHTDTIKQHAKCKTQDSFVIALLCLCVYPSKCTGSLRFTALPSPLLPKLCHEICIQHYGIQSQHTEPKDSLLPLPIAVKPYSLRFQTLFISTVLWIIYDAS